MCSLVPWIFFGRRWIYGYGMDVVSPLPLSTMRGFWTRFSALSLTLLQLTGASGTSSLGSDKCKSIEVRKEWRSLSKSEKKAWVNAVNCLSRTPRSGKLNPPVNTSEHSPFDFIVPVSPEGTYYDELVYTHMNLNPLIHFTGLFLPFHRLYVHEWTNALRSQCGYKGVAPYWAWEYDTADFEHSSIWDTDPVYGLGGFGDPNDDNIVKTGGLNITLAYPIKHKLRRQYQPYPFLGLPGADNITGNVTFTPAEVTALLAQPEGNFTAFQAYLEKFIGMHSAIHGMTGGDLAGRCPRGSNSSNCPFEGAPTFSSNEPLFHFHHGNVDRLWWLWQEKSRNSKYAFHGGSVQNIFVLNEYPNGVAPWLNKTDLIPGAGMFKSVSINDVLDTRKPPLCYVYDG
ncbi:unnamed protein product [Rhizoctonia solani]|uniref:Tyrosinase copper-binding domain-containing protein n=1 Tax=Rhizoctonia solani TaxID=456999 RepID=A0A8H3GIJ6_9AGAM|nr:unnamed protein product [Rhizoctonia solani]